MAALLPWPYHRVGRDNIHVARRALEQQAPAAPYPVEQEDPYLLAVELEVDVEELSLEPAAPLVLHEADLCRTLSDLPTAHKLYRGLVWESNPDYFPSGSQLTLVYR